MLLSELGRTLRGVGVLRDAESRVLIACSGGADSVGLAVAAVEWLGARRVVLAHVDHAVREDSAEDAHFVRVLAISLGARSVEARIEPEGSDEASLRESRYRALERMRAEVGAEWILTAHTRDDQAESFVLGMIRGRQPAHRAPRAGPQ